MNINERVKFVRKNKKMTMEDFGKKLGVTKVAISRIESGDRNLTDQMFLSICREFNVSPDWLRDGTGAPFLEKSRNKRIEEFVDDILTNEPEGRRARLIDALASLDSDGWDKLYEIALRFVAEQNAEKERIERERLHAELDRQLDEEKEAVEKSEVSTAV